MKWEVFWRTIFSMQGPGRGLFADAYALGGALSDLEESANPRVPLNAAGVEILIAGSVAMLVGNHHGNGMPRKPLTLSIFPKPWLQPFAHDRRNARQPPRYSCPGLPCEC